MDSEGSILFLIVTEALARLTTRLDTRAPGPVPVAKNQTHPMAFNRVYVPPVRYNPPCLPIVLFPKSGSEPEPVRTTGSVFNNNQ